MKISTALLTLLRCFDEELKAAGIREDLCALTIYPGNMVPYDYECGSGWVRLVSANPTVAFPAQDLTVNNCTSSMAYPVEMGLVRPGPIPYNFGTDMDLPDDAEQLESALRVVEDMELMRRAIVRASASIPQLLLGAWNPQGPDGGIVGGVWDLTVGDEDD